MNVYINNVGHMNKWLPQPYYMVRPLQKSFSQELVDRFQQNLTCSFGKNTRIELENCNVFINHCLVMTLTLLKARSTLVAFALNKENC